MENAMQLSNFTVAEGGVLYIVGALAMFAFLKYFGKKFLPDYDQEKTYADHDDWSSNAEAYTFFSLVWPLVGGILLIGGSVKFLVKTASKFLK